MKIVLSLPVSDNHIWTKKEENFLKNNYSNNGKLWCCKELNRTDGSIRLKASRLGLKTDKHNEIYRVGHVKTGLSIKGNNNPSKRLEVRKKIKESWKNRDLIKIYTPELRKKLSDNTQKWIKEKGHPRGMLGKHHSDKVKKEMSIRYKNMWANPNSMVNSREFRQEQSDRMKKQIHQRIKTKGTIYSRTHNGWYVIGKRKIYLRSNWEVNYSRYLEWLRLNKKIIKWEYEPKTFWFKKIKRGVRSYTPDFRITNNNGEIEYHEVKGWMDSRSKTKLKRIKKYYPNIKLILIDKIVYRDILRWEKLFSNARKIQE
jgi:hypothetical protein